MGVSLRVQITALAARLPRESLFTVKIVPNNYTFENQTNVIFQSQIPATKTGNPVWIAGSGHALSLGILPGLFGYSVYFVEHTLGWLSTESQLIGSAFVPLSSFLTEDYAQVLVNIYDQKHANDIERRIKIGSLDLTTGRRKTDLSPDSILGGNLRRSITTNSPPSAVRLSGLVGILGNILSYPWGPISDVSLAYSLAYLARDHSDFKDQDTMTTESMIDNPCQDLVAQSAVLAEYFCAHSHATPAVRDLISDLAKALVRSLIPIFAHAHRFTRTKYRDLRNSHLYDETVRCQRNTVKVFAEMVRAVEGQIAPLGSRFLEHFCELVVDDFMQHTEEEKFTGPYSTVIGIARGTVAQEMQAIWKTILYENISTTQNNWAQRRDALRRLISYVARTAIVLPASLILSNKISREKGPGQGILPVSKENEDTEVFYLPEDAHVMYSEYPKDILAAQRNRSGMSGSQAKVGKALMWTGQHAHAVTVALKEIHEEVRRDMLQQVYLEIVMGLTLRHPRIICIQGITLSGGRLALLMPWYENGDALSYLRRLKALGGRSRFIRKINHLLYQVSEGLAYLRQEMVVHGDLGARNIVVDDNGDAIIADFGLTTYANAISRQNQSTRAGNPRWIAPELCEATKAANDYLPTGRPTYSSDLFAFAMVCIEMYSGKVPFYGERSDNIAGLRIKAGERPSWPPLLVDRRLKDVVKRCWNQDPGRRGTADELLQQMRLICSAY